MQLRRSAVGEVATAARCRPTRSQAVGEPAVRPRTGSRAAGEAGWGITSNAAHPGFAKTNLQYQRAVARPAISRRPVGTVLPVQLRRFTPFMWQEIDEGILPALYAATLTAGRRRRVLRAAAASWRLAGGGDRRNRPPRHAERRGRQPQAVGGLRATHRGDIPEAELIRSPASGGDYRASGMSDNASAVPESSVRRATGADGQRDLYRQLAAAGRRITSER